MKSSPIFTTSNVSNRVGAVHGRFLARGPSARACPDKRDPLSLRSFSSWTVSWSSVTFGFFFLDPLRYIHSSKRCKVLDVESPSTRVAPNGYHGLLNTCGHYDGT